MDKYARDYRQFLTSCRNHASLTVTETASGQLDRTLKETFMRYMLLIYGNEKNMQTASKADVDHMLAAYGAYTEALKQAGVMESGDRLQRSGSASTVRVADSKTKVLDGPYADTKEQLGGYYLINVPDLDTALSWAARCPGASHGLVEVRPIWTM
jgi:hypothetical protein